MDLRVVGAGVGRTGTASLKLALERLLGAPCYHAWDLGTQHLDDHVPLWHEAVRGKEPNWDGIYERYAATVDWPAASFWRELHRTYPDSLVLLSTRATTDEWFRSANATIFEFTRQNREREVAKWPPERQAWYSMILEMFETRFTPAPFDEELAKQAYERHNAEVRAEVPANRLLEWHPGDGWAPLCECLEVPVPDEPFPNINQTKATREALGLAPLDSGRGRLDRMRDSWRKPLTRLLRR